MYIARIIRNILDETELVSISQAHRKMKESFMRDKAIEAVNKKLQDSSKMSKKKVTLSVDLPSKNAWENILMTYLDDVP